MGIDDLKRRLEQLANWHAGEDSPPTIEPVFNETLQLLQTACEDGDVTTYDTVAALFNAPKDVSANRVLKDIRTSLRHLCELWESDLEELPFDEDEPPAPQGRLQALKEEIARQEQNVLETLEQEGPQLERLDAINHPRLDNIKYVEETETLDRLSVDLLKLYTGHRKTLRAAVQRVEDESLALLKKSLEHHLGPRGKRLADGITTLEDEDEIDILRKVYPGGATELGRLMDSAAGDEEERRLLLERTFVFEDIVLLDDPAVQRVLRRVPKSDLLIALRGVDEEVADKVSRNLSSRHADELRDDLDNLGPVRRKEVEESQDRIIRIIREMETDGEIHIATAGDDELLI